jgi:putative NAD(P)-binding protein
MEWIWLRRLGSGPATKNLRARRSNQFLNPLHLLHQRHCTRVSAGDPATIAGRATSQIGGLSGLTGMRLFVIGANGRTGSEIVSLALTRGHEVTAFVRSPRKLSPAGSLTIVRGDPRDSETIAPALCSPIARARRWRR